MALVFGRWCVAEELPWMGLRGAGWLEQAWTWWRPWPWACKRQAWRALKADGPSVWPVMFSGRVALDGLAGGEIGFGKACGSMVFGRWCLAEELPWMGLRGASLLEQAWTWWRPWPWQTRFHTSGGPRRRPCLGQGRGRRTLHYTTTTTTTATATATTSTSTSTSTATLQNTALWYTNHATLHYTTLRYATLHSTTAHYNYTINYSYITLHTHTLH